MVGLYCIVHTSMVILTIFTAATATAGGLVVVVGVQGVWPLKHGGQWCNYSMYAVAAGGPARRTTRWLPVCLSVCGL